MKWIDALKLWNKAHGGSWCVPRKGTPEHTEVKAIMSGEHEGKMIKGAQKAEFNPKKRRGAVADLREAVAAARKENIPKITPPRRPSVAASEARKEYMTKRRDSNTVSFIANGEAVSFPVRNPILGRLPPIRGAMPRNLPGMVDDF